jgi:uncharacterized membrane protein
MMAIVVGAVLCACGAGLLAPRVARIAAPVLAGVLLVRWLLIQLPHVVAHPLLELTWYDLSENLTLIAGAWTVFGLLSRNGAGKARLGRILFALAMPAIGLSHIFYVNQTAPLIPSWLPFHVALAYLTGAAHIAAGMGILLGIRPAAILEAVMVSLFTLLIWVPMVIKAPAVHGNWSEFCISTAITGAAWAVAASFGRRNITRGA